MLVVGVDVGVSTGIAIYDPDIDTIIASQTVEINNLEHALDIMQKALPNNEFTYVVEYPITVAIMSNKIAEVRTKAVEIMAKYNNVFEVTPSQWKNSRFKKWVQKNRDVPDSVTKHECDAANMAKYWYVSSTRKSLKCPRI